MVRMADSTSDRTRVNSCSSPETNESTNLDTNCRNAVISGNARKRRTSLSDAGIGNSTFSSKSVSTAIFQTRVAVVVVTGALAGGESKAGEGPATRTSPRSAKKKACFTRNAVSSIGLSSFWIISKVGG